MAIEMNVVGYVETTRSTPADDYWGDERSIVRLSESFDPSALHGLNEFSHVEILFVFHHVHASEVVVDARHPRGNSAWPLVGIFAQRGKNRPNRIGASICRVVRVQERCLYVAELDAIDGSPVLDIKPVMQEFLPRHPVVQPSWSRELMEQYWLKPSS